LIVYITETSRNFTFKILRRKIPFSQRVAIFLKNYPPFNGLKYERLWERLSEGKFSIIIQKKKEVLFLQEKEEGHSFFYLVHKGAVSLYKKKTNQ